MADDLFDVTRVAQHFEKSLLDDGDDGRVKLTDYASAYREINKLFNQLGSIFVFVRDDIDNKCAILDRHLSGPCGLHYRTVNQMLDFELESGIIKPENNINKINWGSNYINININGINDIDNNNNNNNNNMNKNDNNNNHDDDNNNGNSNSPNQPSTQQQHHHQEQQHSKDHHPRDDGAIVDVTSNDINDDDDDDDGDDDGDVIGGVVASSCKNDVNISNGIKINSCNVSDSKNDVNIEDCSKLKRKSKKKKKNVDLEREKNLEHKKGNDVSYSDLPSGSRSLLRLHRAMEFIVQLFPTLVRLPATAGIRGAIKDLYDRTLGTYHPWIARKAVHLALLAACPTRHRLLALVDPSGDLEVVEVKVDRLTKVADKIREIVQREYESRGLLNLA